MKATALAVALAAVASAAAANGAGLKLTDMYMPHHDADARVAIWYPAGAGGTPNLYADSPVFLGVEASLDASIAPGEFPVVLFSHGMGGTDRAQAWLASELAIRGAIVVMVNHPNSTWGDFDMADGVRHWTRAEDLSTALDIVSGDPVFGSHIDLSRVMAAGFSYGGWTALSLGGMTGNLDGIVAACTLHIETMQACDVLLSEDVGMQRQDSDTWNDSYADTRVNWVVAIDPGFVWGLEGADAAALVPNVLLIGLGDALTRMSATDFDESGLTALLPNASLVRLSPAFHFTAMPLCKPNAPAILKADEDDPVCTDPPQTDRLAVHAAIIDAMSRTLGM